MSQRAAYALIAVLAAAAGATFWALDRPAGPPRPTPATIGPAALYATTFHDAEGRGQSLGKYQGRVLLVNFWATWCAPCREEMPALTAAARRWEARGVTVVGLSSEPAEVVGPFSRANPVGYVLGTGPDVDELGRRLGDTAGVLPYSALIGRDGRVLDQKVGPYTAEMLDRIFAEATQTP